MPRVEKTDGGLVYLRPLDRRFEIGDQVDVDEEMAAYLCEERGDFEYVRDIEARAAEVKESLVDEPASDEEETTEGEDGSNTCDVVKSDGEVCGRDLPCAYHSDEEA
ncbi:MULTISPECIES: hypothetical protein [Halorussus]|uniref:hypothetical protein n=1 Tax=Halorussus TaxID=1070314 RepID=UPI0020A1B7D8|nr:hypothetical protein [Halorussus vallis]USZ75660.1 hypothetical protein NGM07_19805 [Halorussus vallis]USZ75715.1 hypothetical protein NGM07_20085 [Halorussus vallis]USZ75733.1 hypothetical protein NGM07_00030 [Halorussus vallis]